MNQVRRQKVQELIKEEASEILQRHLRDPRIGFVSVTDVELSADLRHAKIYVSVLGDDEAKRRTMEGLERATGFVRTELGRRIKLRYLPEVLFRLDESIERGTRIVSLLRQVAREEGREPGETAPDPHAKERPASPGSPDVPTRQDRRGPPRRS